MRLAQELIILGLLKSKPRHGYEIKKQIKEVVGTFAATEAESVYYSLSLLEKSGFLRKRSTARDRRLEKFVYSLTPKGGQRFARLLAKSILTVERPKFVIDAALYFLPYLPAGVAVARLRGRARMLAKMENVLKRLRGQLKIKSSYHLKSIVEHNLELLQAEKKFIQRLARGQAPRQ